MGARAEAIPQSERKRFTVADVLRMVDAGVFAEDDRVELVDGEILMVPPQGPDHGALKDELHARLVVAYAGVTVHVLDQRPIVAGESGLPEPDLAIVKGAPRDYLARHPKGEDTVLVIEIAKTSQSRDIRKAADYARGLVPELWILDLAGRRLNVHTSPDAVRGEYQSRVSLGETDQVALPIIGVIWTVASMLP